MNLGVWCTVYGVWCLMSDIPHLAERYKKSAEDLIPCALVKVHSLAVMLRIIRLFLQLPEERLHGTFAIGRIFLRRESGLVGTHLT